MAPRVLADHNGGVSENVFFDFDREYGQLKAQASTIAGKMRALKKRADQDGIDVEEYEYQRKRRNRPLEERRKAYEDGRLYLKFWKDPLGAKMNPIAEFSDEVGLSDEERQKKWEDEGYVAGRQAKDRSACPHEDPNSMGARYWYAGYERGQTENAKGIKKGASKLPTDDKITPKPKPEVVAAGAKKRGRPSKAAKDAEAKAAKDAADKAEAEAAAKAAAQAHTGGDVRVSYWHDVAGHRGDVRVSYWHDVAGHRVLKISDGSAPPKGAENLTKPEFEKLEAKYKAEEEDDWNKSAKDSDAKPGTAAPEAGGGEDELPPASPTLQ